MITGLQEKQGGKAGMCEGGKSGRRVRWEGGRVWHITDRQNGTTYNINPSSIHSRDARSEAETLCYPAEEMRRIFAGAGLGGEEDEGAAFVARGGEGDRDGSGGRGGHDGCCCGDGGVVEGRCEGGREGKVHGGDDGGVREGATAAVPALGPAGSGCHGI